MLTLAVENDVEDVDLVKSFCREMLIRDGLKHNTIYNREKIIRKMTCAIGTQRPIHEHVEQYLAEYPREADSYLFTTLHGNRQCSPWALRLLVNTVKKRTTITKRVHPHKFRHSLATNMILRGASPITVQRMLGHANLSTTMDYITSNDRQLVSQYNVYVPSYT